MAEKVISILLSAKDATASAFDRAKGGIKSLSDDTQKATKGMKDATEAVSKAMRGDLVGAAQSAASAFKALWSVVLANPLAALVAVIAAAAIELAKLWYESKMGAAEFSKATADANKYALSINEIEHGSRLEREAAKASTMTLKELSAEYEKHIEIAQEKKRVALEAADAALSANKKERDDAIKYSEEKKKAFADEMAIVKQYEKAAFDKAAEIEKAYKIEVDASRAASEEKAAAAVAAYLREKDAFRKAREAAQEESEKIKKAYADVYDSVFPAEISEGGFDQAFEDFTASLEESAQTILEKEKEIAKEKEDAAAATAAEGRQRITDAAELLKTEKEINTEKQKALTAAAKDRGAAWRNNDPWKNVVDPWDARGGKWKPGAEPIGNLPKIPPLPNGQNAGAGGQANDPWSPKLDAIKTEITGLRGDLTGGGAA